MFEQDNIIEFINKIINYDDDKTSEETQENLRKFRSYLELTQMCDSDTLDKVDKVLECYDSLVDIKRSFGFVDVSSLFDNEKKDTVRRLVKKREVPRRTQVRDEYEDKHYHHYSSSYQQPSYSSGCGGSPSYSSGCGGGSSYRSGC